MAMPARSSASASAPRAVDVRARRRRTRDGGRRATVRPTATRDGDARARARDENEASTSMGSVCLVGAGPGGVDALTMGAARALANADVVVYDDLGGSSEDVLALATKANAEFVSVGKRGGSAKSWTQSDICELLVELARSGKRVARLKGGCPSVFARVSDEIAALRKHGVHTYYDSWNIVGVERAAERGDSVDGSRVGTALFRDERARSEFDRFCRVRWNRHVRISDGWENTSNSRRIAHAGRE